MIKQLLIITLSVFALQGCNTVQYQAEQGSEVEKNSLGKWAIEPQVGLPNVLILGDSISIGYTLEVRQQLAGRANVFRPHTQGGEKAENCQGTNYSIDNIERWTAGHTWQVIHFNWGLHDLKHIHGDSGKNSNNFADPRQSEPEAYRTNLIEIVEQLQATGAKLIFATTTPYPNGVKPARAPMDAQIYNDIAKQVMREKGIQVNDLYEFSVDKLAQIQLPKNVHFNKLGRKLQAEQVVKYIKPYL